MTNVKCIRCGALNLDTAQICKVCQIELMPLSPPISRPIPFSQPTTGWDSNTGSITVNSIAPFNDMSDALGPTFSLFKTHFWLITKITVVIVAPFEIFKTLNPADVEENWPLFASMFVLEEMCKVLIAPALIYALMQVMQTGIAPGVNEAYHWGVSKLGKLIFCAAMAFALQTLGLALCFIPGIIISLALVLAFPIAILENGSAAGALESSYHLTKGHRWRILGVTLVLWMLIFVCGLPEKATAAAAASTGGLWLFHLLAAIFSDIIEQSTTVMSLVIYLSIRAFWSQSTQ